MRPDKETGSRFCLTFSSLPAFLITSLWGDSQKYTGTNRRANRRAAMMGITTRALFRCLIPGETETSAMAPSPRPKAAGPPQTLQSSQA